MTELQVIVFLKADRLSILIIIGQVTDLKSIRLPTELIRDPFATTFKVYSNLYFTLSCAMSNQNSI